MRAPAPNSVAVLYFEPRDTVDAYLADGLTVDVATLLGNVPSVQVKPPGVVRRAQRATPQDFPAIARALSVRYLVDGSVRRAGARLHVTVRLVIAGTTVSAWGEILDRTPDEFPTLPSVIARDVASRIAGTSAAATAQPAAPRTPSPGAYDHFLRGNFFLALRTPEGITRAIAEYREAERLDSGFAAAIGRAAYAIALAQANYFSIPDVPPESVAARGLAVADRALRRDSTSSDAWMARGFLLAYATPHTLAGSIEALRRANAIDPRNAEAHHQYAQILNWLGRFDDADRELRTAIELEPDRVVSYCDLALWNPRRDPAVVLALTDTAVALDPASSLAHWARGLARALAGDFRGAVEDGESANRLSPGLPNFEGFLAYAAARSGDTTRARSLLAHWPGHTEFGIALAILALGDTAAVLDRLEQSPQNPNRWALMLQPEFDPLHGNTRYERLLATLRPLEAVGP
ncbi:MAG TPA: tetratricopeptide repeat protein [Gemmatimonadales bacterium]|nr:tetratricopeptide repeat protein [Gemmatimonadales bacterium]